MKEARERESVFVSLREGERDIVKTNPGGQNKKTSTPKLQSKYLKRGGEEIRLSIEIDEPIIGVQTSNYPS